MDIADNEAPYIMGLINLNGIEFFNCLTEIRDDGGYEWYPDNDVVTTVCKGNQTSETIFKQYGTFITFYS